MRYAILVLLLLTGVAQAGTQVELFPPGFSAKGDLDDDVDVTIRGASPGVAHCVTSIEVASMVAGVADARFRIKSDNGTTESVIWQWGIDVALSIGTSAVLNPPVCAVAGEVLEIDLDVDPNNDLITYSMVGYSR